MTEQLLILDTMPFLPHNLHSSTPSKSEIRVIKMTRIILALALAISTLLTATSASAQVPIAPIDATTRKADILAELETHLRPYRTVIDSPAGKEVFDKCISHRRAPNVPDWCYSAIAQQVRDARSTVAECYRLRDAVYERASEMPWAHAPASAIEHANRTLNRCVMRIEQSRVH
jgi:hypothetical protein